MQELMQGRKKDMAQEGREGIRKTKAQLELNLARDVKNNKKGFFRYTGQQRKMKETVPPPLSKTGELAITNMAEALNNVCASIFTGKCSSHTA